jgi:hypothetical protein
VVDIAYVGKASVLNATSGTSTVVPVPAGVAQGHRLVAYVGSIGSSPTITDPAGWQKIAEYAPGSTLKTAVYYRDVPAGAEPASYTWGWSASGRNFGQIVAYSGCDLTAAPVATPALVENVAAAGSVAAPSTSLVGGDWLLTLIAGRENPGTDTAKNWTKGDALDVERHDEYSTNTGTGAKLTAAFYDSNRALTTGNASRSVSTNVAMPQAHVWSVRLVSQVTSSPGVTPAATGPAAIGFIGKAYVFNSTGGATTIVPVPAGVAEGHRMLAFVGSIGASPTITDPAGWQKIAEYAPGSTMKTAVYYRDVPAGAEPASYTWAWSSNGRNWGYALAYEGVDLAQAPLAAPEQLADVAAGAAMVSPAVSLLAGDWLVTLLGGRENPGTDTAKEWTNGDPLDAERLNFYSSNTGTAAKSAAVAWDSGRAMPAGAATRSIAPSVAIAQVHLWSVRLAAKGGTSGGGDGGGVVSGSASWSRMGLPRA